MAGGLTARDARLRRLYNVTEDEWNAVLEFQGGGCAIGGERRATRSLQTDHDHSTGEFRGILCARHNVMLREGVTPEALRAAADYLESPPARSFFGEPRFGRVGRVTNKRRRRRRRGGTSRVQT